MTEFILYWQAGVTVGLPTGVITVILYNKVMQWRDNRRK